MARKKLERRVKKIIIRVGNIEESFQLDSNEKLAISKELRTIKMNKIKKELAKVQHRIRRGEEKLHNSKEIYQRKSIIIPRNFEKIQQAQNIHDNRETTQEKIILNKLLKETENHQTNNYSKDIDESENFFDEYLFDLP